MICSILIGPYQLQSLLKKVYGFRLMSFLTVSQMLETSCCRGALLFALNLPCDTYCPQCLPDSSLMFSYDHTRCENVQRSFKIKKAMLSNHRNYRSSYDRLFEQVSRREETTTTNANKQILHTPYVCANFNFCLFFLPLAPVIGMQIGS